ncbi:Gfo/Idh/MocA family oxidoreductase [Sediminibacterium sp.]|uniref:Gfo/Idh/MocA family oxidoreductase n=1 Tax=Sediminibacterium sp. TaxID=1917865 RepID=UPI00273057C5|nr:Gfo/Idh/MocA family oxidoreductase [Sediminibacterium sp.]MDP2420235.1 Gfo/Idh/MocA family oxidoreductase [Sediminibacterium sp.]
MKTILIIGAGQLGSRHLQGLAKFKGQLDIYVVDPALDSLKTAQVREEEIIHEHRVIYTLTWDLLPSSFDVVIVATSANIRERIIFELLRNYKVGFLILEKVLFQELASYRNVSDLFVEKNVRAYVNHPRRMFESYKNLGLLLDTNDKTVFSVVGGSWGLACNALHFLDLFVYLSGKKLKDINTDSLDELIQESSRKGFVEFTGTLSGQLEDGSFFSITSLNGASTPISVSLFNNEQRFLIQEGGLSQIYMLLKKDNFVCKNESFKVQYQSELTTNILIEIFENNHCSLPTYEEARHSHEIFLKAMLKKYNTITGFNCTILPIT